MLKFNFYFFFRLSWMRKSENVSLIVLKFSFKTNFFLLSSRLFQKFSLSLRKRRSRSLLSLFFLSWEWKFFTRNKTFQRLDNFVKVSLTCVKIRRFRFFDSSMISAILSVEKYDFANTVTIIANHFSVSMFVSMSVSFRLFVKKKKRNSVFDLVRFSILKSSDAVFFSTFSTFFNALSVSSTLLNVASFSTRF